MYDCPGGSLTRIRVFYQLHCLFLSRNPSSYLGLNNIKTINLWIFSVGSHYSESVSPGNGNLNKVPLGGGSMDLEDKDNQYMCNVTVHLTAVCTVHWIVHSLAA